MSDNRSVEQVLTHNIKEAEKLWVAIIENCDRKRVAKLTAVLDELFNDTMSGESNATVLMALTGWMSGKAMTLSDESGISPDGALMTIQIGLQRAILAHVQVRRAELELQKHGKLDS